MGSLLQLILSVARTILRPITRLMVGLIAIPIFRFLMRHVFRVNGMNEEFEKDLEQWFRGALLLLAATANMEHLLFGWLTRVDWLDRADWLTLGLRLMLAIGVIEAMPDQNIFAVIHPGPPKLRPGRGLFREFWKVRREYIKGVICQHLNRSSPVLAMMCAIVGAQVPVTVVPEHTVIDRHWLLSWSYSQPIAIDLPSSTLVSHQLAAQMPDLLIPQQLATRMAEYQRYRERWFVGWICYLLAVTQYLIIGLITSRDRSGDVLKEFDRAVARRREELITEFQLDQPRAETGRQAPGEHFSTEPLKISTEDISREGRVDDRP